MLAGKNCLVTGSTGGIGKGIARSLLQQGAFVFINGRSEETVNATAASFTSEGLTNFQGVVANIGTVEGSEKLFAEVEASGRQIDVLVNNLGVFNSGSFFDYTDDQWSDFFNVNILTTVRMSRKYLKGMLERNAGRVIIVSSEAGMRSIPDMIPYTVTKAAQINLARGLAELTKGTNVTVNSLLPGPTSTEGLEVYIDGLAAQAGTSREETIRNYFKTREPTSLLERFLTVEEVANVAMFLASDLSSGVNGTAQRVEGGIIRHL